MLKKIGNTGWEMQNLGFPNHVGAVKGTNLKDLCNIVGGMSPGDTVKIKATDGFTKTFAYENVYTPPTRQGPMVITWYHSGDGYVPQYRDGMRLIFFADNSTNQFRHSTILCRTKESLFYSIPAWAAATGSMSLSASTS
jgi:hypothetical protein